MALIALEPHVSAALQPAIVIVSLAVGSVGASVAVRARGLRRADGKALRLARERETLFAAAASRLTCAARDSAAAVRAELAAAVRTAAPAADGVLLYDERDGALCCTLASGERFAYFEGSVTALDDPAALPVRALDAGHRVALADGGVRPLHPRDASAVAVPVTRGCNRRCVLAVASQHVLEKETIEQVVALADHAAPAYLIALDREQDRYDAEYDGLTGLLTPRAFRQRLAVLLEGMRFSSSARLGLLFLDTDHFKHWNDRFGHAAGDALLRELANVLRAGVSRRDLAGRNGGDEFCVVFTDTDKSTAIERAELLRRRIAALDMRDLLPAGSASDLPITASIGVAAYPADASSASDLLERADAAMYHSKLSGRDGVSYCCDQRFTRLIPGSSCYSVDDARGSAAVV